VKSLKAAIEAYKNADVVWCQEEPENNGGWTFVDRRIESVLTCLDNAAKRPKYVGRKAAASPATGLAKTHAAEQAALVNEALTV
jgi:2-oxoglutarate dehydrogenase E1 component